LIASQVERGWCLLKVTEDVYYYPGKLFDSNIFVVLDPAKGRLMVIDTGTGMFYDDFKRRLIKDGLNPEDISKVVLTHVHVDHSGGLARIADEFSPEVLVFHMEADSVEEGGDGLLLAEMFNFPFTPTKVHVRLKEGDTIRFGRLLLEVLNTPGHTIGSICLYDRERKILFSGDTVFTHGSFGRVDFPTGSPQQLLESLKRLSKLDVEYLLPGHLDIARGNGSEHIKLSLKYAKALL